MILHEIHVPYKYGDVFTLKPIFDVHLGNTYCDKKSFKAFLADTDEKTLIIGGGDLLDSIITKDVKRYMKHSDDTPTDSIIDDQVNEMVDILMPYKKQIVGLGTGNHESTINKYCGTHPIRRICKALDTVSLGFSWIVRIRFTENGSRGRTLLIRGHHGWGGGSRTQGADLTKYSKDIAYWPDCNIMLYGHTHKRQADKIDCVGVCGKRLISKPKHVFICGTYLKTYSNSDEATYSEEKGYPPTSIGGLNIFLKPDKNWITISNDL